MILLEPGHPTLSFSCIFLGSGPIAFSPLNGGGGERPSEASERRLRGLVGRARRRRSAGESGRTLYRGLNHIFPRGHFRYLLDRSEYYHHAS